MIAAVGSHDYRRRPSSGPLAMPTSCWTFSRGPLSPVMARSATKMAPSLPTLRARAPDVGAISRALIQIAERYPRRRRILPPRVVSNLRLHGYVPHARVGDFYNRAVALACTSVTDAFRTLSWRRGAVVDRCSAAVAPAGYCVTSLRRAASDVERERLRPLDGDGDPTRPGRRVSLSAASAKSKPQT
jgi:hypothetical protein